MKPEWMTAPMSKSLAGLKTEAQKLFNAFIVRRDKDCECIYCGYKSFGKGLYSAEAAHFIPVSTGEAIRYHEMNAHKAHQGCNRKDNREAYRANLIIKIGLDNVLMLESMQHSLAKFSKSEVEEIITRYKS